MQTEDRSRGGRSVLRWLWSGLIATAADTVRRSVIGGSNEAPTVRASDRPATASAAAAIIRSLIRVALTTATPRPRPGNTSALLAWAIV